MELQWLWYESLTSVFDPVYVGFEIGTDELGKLDTCYIHSSRPPLPAKDRKLWLNYPVAHLSSAYSGVSLKIYTDQDALQVYNCVGQDGTLPLKKTQGVEGGRRVIEKYGCVVLEVQDWIDGINHPEWRRSGKQIFGPDTGPYELNARYVFSVDGER